MKHSDSLQSIVQETALHTLQIQLGFHYKMFPERQKTRMKLEGRGKESEEKGIRRWRRDMQGNIYQKNKKRDYRINQGSKKKKKRKGKSSCHTLSIFCLTKTASYQAGHEKSREQTWRLCLRWRTSTDIKQRRERIISEWELKDKWANVDPLTDQAHFEFLMLNANLWYLHIYILDIWIQMCLYIYIWNVKIYINLGLYELNLTC